MDPTVQKPEFRRWDLAIQIGLKWVRFHFLKKSKLVKSSIFNGGFAFYELGSFSRFYVFKKGWLATGAEQLFLTNKCPINDPK